MQSRTAPSVRTTSPSIPMVGRRWAWLRARLMQPVRDAEALSASCQGSVEANLNGTPDVSLVSVPWNRLRRASERRQFGDWWT